MSSLKHSSFNMDKPMGLDSFDLVITNCKKEDLQKKIDIAYNVLVHCQRDAKSIDKLSSLELCSKVTGVDKGTLESLKLLEDKGTKFDEWFFEQKQMIHGYTYQYCRLRKELIESYTKKLEIPTGLKEKKEIENLNRNFMYLQLPETKASIIVEKPETVQERYRFLRAKTMYREAKKHIVYTGRVNIMVNHGKFSYKEDSIHLKSRFMIAASPTLGHIGYIYCCGTVGDKEEFITNWIKEKIINKLPKESVIIFQENVMDSVSGIDSLSTKEDMINWLKCNEVNHDPDMHRADLFKLINAFKQGRVDELSTAEKALRASGHITLRKKKCNLNNNYFDPFWDFFIHELNAGTQEIQPVRNTLKNHTYVITKTANVIVKNVPLDYWENLEKILLDKEREIYKDDLEMEHVIDKIVTMVKYEGLPTEVKLDEYSKMMEQPHIFLADGLRNLYLHSSVKNYASLNISK